MSDYRQNSTGKVITEEELRKIALESNTSFEELIQEAGMELITEDPGNTTGSATGVNALPNNQTTPMGTVLDLEDTSSELPKTDPEDSAERDLLVSSINETERQINNYISQGGEANQSDAAVLQGYRDKLSALDENTWADNFALNVDSPKLSDLTQEQIVNIQDKAIKELTSKYKNEKDEYYFDETDVKLKAASIFENQILPKVSLEKDTTLEKFVKEKAPILNPYADFISDIYTAGAQGLSTSGLVDPTFELLKKGSGSSDEDITKWIETNKKVASENMQSDEMRDFNKIYEENGSGVFGFIKGVVNNPSIMPSLLVSSLATQIGSLQSEEVALTAAAGAGIGAAVGSVIPVAGTAAGAISGGIGAGAAAMEASLTFSELLQEEIGEDLSLESVRSLFKDEKRVADLQSKAVKRGIAIGLVEGLTGGIARGVTGKVLKAGFKKPIAAIAGVGVESIGGGTGEIAGRLAADQKMDVAEIGFEAITGTTTAPITVGSKLINLDNKIANYKINKELKH